MEAKTELSKMKARKGPWLMPLLSSTALMFISGIAKAGEPVTTLVNAVDTLAATDSLATDSLATAAKKGLRGIDDGGVLTYTLIVVGIIVIIGFAFLTSVRNSKKANTGAPVGYRKPHHHHHHKHKI